MNAKRLVTAILLLFVAASIVAWGMREFRARPGGSGQPAGTINRTSPPQPDSVAHSSPVSRQVIAYYFHRSERCDTCNKLESYSREAVESGFAEYLNDRRIQWRVINYQQPENQHFREEYELLAPSLVLVALSGGRRADWKDLPRIWELVDDKKAFIQYVQEEVRAFLESSTKEPRNNG